MIPVGPDTRVTLNFAIKLDDNQVIDSNLEQDPVSFVVGDGKLLEGFERSMFGLTAGDNKEFELPAEEAFGPHNPDNVQKFARDEFPDDTELEEGLVMVFSDPAQGEVPGVVVDLDERYATVDFNHPLAGRTIRFEVRIVDVAPATTH